MPESPKQQNAPDFPLGEIIVGLLRSVCLTIDVFLHRRLGVTYVSSGFAAVLVLFVVIAQFPPGQQRALIDFGWIYFVVWLISLVSTYVREWRSKTPVHTGYTGEPHLRKLLPGWREEYLKQLEAVVVILLAILIHHFSRALGDYLIGAASLVFARGWLLMARQRQQVRMMNDLVIEQRITSERLNG